MILVVILFLMILKPDSFVPFEYWTSLTFRHYLYLEASGIQVFGTQLVTIQKEVKVNTVDASKKWGLTNLSHCGRSAECVKCIQSFV